MDIIVLFLLFTSPIWLTLLYKYNRYSKSAYKKETNNSFLKVLKDTGLIGEYYSVEVLVKVKGYHKLLLNCYLPNGREGTSETDIIFLHETGIYVLESKNYSGWIFGQEKDKKWCQVFPNKHKEFFYNPIKQNKTHIQMLQRNLDFVPAQFFKSVIVFSNRCELKKITVDSQDVVVLKRNQLSKTINNEIKNLKPVFTIEEIDHIYQILKPFTNVTTEVKKRHIQKIKSFK
ncbi:nuclease-related domain-containing protein [Ectobacillus polymachus]|uniref:nuclease-related domain-containing protein n=1 Tax=Ectobacillus polymachus TaxID=1508806 RepID=UPI003A8AE88E